MGRKKAGICQFMDVFTRRLLSLWTLRAMVRLGSYRMFWNMHSEKRVFEMLGSEPASQNPQKHSRRMADDSQEQQELYNWFDALLKKAEAHKQKNKLPSVLAANIKKISQLTGLNTEEEMVLAFCVMFCSSSILEDIFDLYGDIQKHALIEMISVILDMDSKRVSQILSADSTLCKTGLVSIEKDRSRSSSRITLLSRGFAHSVLTNGGDVFEMIKDSVRRCEKSQLEIGDFEQIREHCDVLLPYLDKCTKKAKVGVNILLYGNPGTGKTEFVKVVAKTLGYQLGEITFADENDEPIRSDERLNALKAAQAFFAKQKSLLVLDEAEDVFTLSERNIFGYSSSRQKNKAWMNRALEQNQIPTFWVTNSIYGLDEALLRRFDMCIEMPMPNKKKRKELIGVECKNMLTHETIESLSNCEYISPAMLNKAAGVAKEIGFATKQESSSVVELLVDSKMRAQGKTFVRNSAVSCAQMSYNPEFINTDTPLLQIKDGICNSNSARICLYGPPGTGKSAFGKWIADELGKPIMLKKASDLISMWVGQTEKNIAGAFKEASSENAVLVIDEVDSFLQDRRGAQRSWEVTAVNEMLVQMENYEGVFVATTNIMDGLDQASLRRFDLKLKFDYMTQGQVRTMFEQSCKMLGIAKPCEDISHLSNLTPGDFAAVLRQARFSPVKDSMDLLHRLVSESSIKEDADSNIKMGFLRQ